MTRTCIAVLFVSLGVLTAGCTAEPDGEDEPVANSSDELEVEPILETGGGGGCYATCIANGGDICGGACQMNCRRSCRPR
jgi:hypothetical protein